MAGTVAALAAKEAGADVQLATRAPGSTALCGGLVEVALDPVGRTLPAVDAATALATRQPSHPYALLRSRLDRLPGALRLLRQRLAPLFRFGGEGPAELFATTLGGLRAGALAHAAQAVGALRPGTRAAVGWFRNQPAILDGALIAGGIREAGFDAEPYGLDYLNREEQLSWTMFELARWLDRPGEAKLLGESIRRAKPSADVLLLPPLLGLERHEEVLAELSQQASLPCAELVAGTPSVPGLRLQRALERALATAGIEVERGDVTKLYPGKALLKTDGGDRELAFDDLVLAAGRFVGGGVERERTFSEPLLGLPVWDGTTQLAFQPIDTLLGEGPGSPCAAFRAGLRFDSELHPLDDDGNPVMWARIAGALLAGSDHAVDGSGLGLAAFTGFLAGRLAAGVAP
jgi:glycerol-3-phosphate dehydrogenase subunit B